MADCITLYQSTFPTCYPECDVVTPDRGGADLTLVHSAVSGLEITLSEVSDGVTG